MATDKQITQLTALTSLGGGDNLTVTRNLGGSNNVNRKIEWQHVKSGVDFATLADVTGAYTVPHSLYKVNAAGTALEETGITMPDLAANKFQMNAGTTTFQVEADLTVTGSTNVLTLTSGTGEITLDAHCLYVLGSGSSAMTLTGDLTLAADLNVEAASRINQDLTTDATPTFAGATLTSTTEALTIPRMTTTEKNALTPVNGMVVYDATLGQFQKYENGAWADTEGNNTFSGLTDVSGAYTTVFTIFRVNAAVNGVEETTILAQEPAANQFSFSRGSSSLLVKADLTVEATSLINQDLTTDATPTFDKIIQTVNTANVSNPPTDAELDALYGAPSEVGAGFTFYIDDNGGGANFYQIVSDGTNWWIFTGSKAV